MRVKETLTNQRIAHGSWFVNTFCKNFFDFFLDSPRILCFTVFEVIILSKDVRVAVGSRIREIRLARGFSQKTLADMIGVTKGAIGNYENGTSSPRDTILHAIIKALDIDANYLFQDVVPIKSELFLSPNEHDLIILYRSLNAEGQEKVVEYAEDLVAGGRYDKKSSENVVVAKEA